jgi:ribosomal peptide maturation radical SAM protein 1
MADVALIQMPYALSTWPSLGLSLLKAGLKQRNIAADIHYLNIRFEGLVGSEIYDYIAGGMPCNTDLLGEWSFAESLWGSNPTRDEAYLKMLTKSRDWDQERQVSRSTYEQARLNGISCRSHTQEFLSDCLRDIDWLQYRVVGFTSVFQQHLPSLALAKLIKSLFPDILIIFGGSNCEGAMGRATLRCFPFVDAVCCGEGDEIFPRFIEGLLAGETPKLEGILLRNSKGTATQLNVISDQSSEAAPIVDLNAVPYPDFDEFFANIRSDKLGTCSLVFETSRGCWWGQKHHCTFCGLNGNGMQFRHKSAQRAFDELQWLTARYGAFTNRVQVTDNIMPYEYFSSFLPRLAEREAPLDIFYETKANLKYQHLALYKSAGLSRIQPGIESLSSKVLSLMDKGVSALQNIQTLKFCSELGIVPMWNYLLGFPGERPEWYLDQPGLLRRLTHLTPPVGCSRVRFDRFSRYLSAPSSFALDDITPYPAYQYIYPELMHDDVADLAYFFTARFPGDEAVNSYAKSTIEAVVAWQKTHETICLYHLALPDNMYIVFDSRETPEIDVTVLRGIHAQVAHICHNMVPISELADLIARELHGPSVDSNRVDEAVRDLESKGLIVTEGGKALSLSLPLGSHSRVSPHIVRKFETLFAARPRGEGPLADTVIFSPGEFNVVGTQINEGEKVQYV